MNLSVTMEGEAEAPDYFFGESEGPGRKPAPKPKPRPRGRYRAQGTGSGFIVDPRGYVLTNGHVVRDAKDIRVTLTLPDGKERTYFGQVAGRDPNLDLALVKIRSEDRFPFLELSEEAPRVGDWALAIGSPFALEQTVTVGVVSAMRRSMHIEGRNFGRMLQTDAAINQGNSGGPLLDFRGRVIGVNTAIFSPSGASAGIGFAIPAKEALKSLESLMGREGYRQAWLGLDASAVDEAVRRRFGLPTAAGVLVSDVALGGPAAAAGILRGDVLRTLDGKPLSGPDALSAAVAPLKSGARVLLEVYRGGAPRDVTLVLGRRPASGSTQDAREPGKENSFWWEGALFSDELGDLSVARIRPGSALEGKLLSGDMLRGVNGVPVATLDDLRRATGRARLSDGAVFDVLRGGRQLYVSAKSP